MTTKKIRIYGDSRSGNCYKLQLLCSEMGVSYDWKEVDILAGETRTPEFLAMNANGKIPLLALPDGRYLAESNAILCYLADGSEFFGSTAYSRAEILQWMFFEQYSHEPYIATSRFIIRYLNRPAEREADLNQKKAGGYAALGVMERQLQQHDFLVDDRFTVADIALFAYTHVAHEGDFELKDYPAVVRWIGRISSRTGYTPMESP
jgi:glutathione S-transferase